MIDPSIDNSTARVECRFERRGILGCREAIWMPSVITRGGLQFAVQDSYSVYFHSDPDLAKKMAFHEGFKCILGS